MRFMNIHELIGETLRSNKYSKKLLLIRHGTSLGNVTPRIHGNSEYPLTPKGQAQAEELGIHLRKYIDQIVHIRSSNLIRSLDTCRIAMQMSARRDLYERFLIDPRLKEFVLYHFKILVLKFTIIIVYDWGQNLTDRPFTPPKKSGKIILN